MLKVFICTNGCPRRQLDASRLKKYFELNNCLVLKNPEESNKIIFVTCSFKEDRKNECFKLIEKFSKLRGELILLGCLPGMLPNELKKKFNGKSLTTSNLNSIDNFFPDFKIKFCEVNDANFREITEYFKRPEPLYMNEGFSKEFFKKAIKYSNPEYWYRKGINAADKILNPNLEKYASIRISNGCISKCAYCGIHKAVGKLRSKPLKECLKEYKKLLDLGYRKFVFSGENVGAYGLDIGLTFEDFVNSMSELDKGLEVIWGRIEMHPIWIIKYQKVFLKIARKKKLESLTISMQSGSERILKLMNRYSDVEKMIKAILELKKANPKINLAVQIIIGFPSETEEDFKKTLELLEKVKFDIAVVYKYFDIPGAASSKMSEKIDDNTIQRRIKTAVEFLNKICPMVYSDDILKT